MTYLYLISKELQPGDHWGDDDDHIVESIEPMESPTHCRILFANGGTVVWPLEETPVRVWRPNLKD